MTFLRTITFSTALPTLLSAVMPRVVVRHVVRESGKLNFTEARPSAPVFTSATQNAVSGNALRTLGSTRRSGLISASHLCGLTFASCICFLPASP